MFVKKDRIITNINELSNYVEEMDFCNSRLLYELARPELDREIYEISVYEYRPDLIAKDFYGDESYMGIIMLQVPSGFLGLKRGNKLRLISKKVVNSIIQDL